jgi:hypothetical protein
MTLVVNDNELWIKEKINEIHLHPLIGCISIVICDKYVIILMDKMKTNDVLPHVPSFSY